MAHSETLHISTAGNTDILDLTTEVQRVVRSSAIETGQATVFVIGSTATISTIEFEPGLVNHDIRAALEKLAPEAGRYLHEETWHDDNGHSHVRATVMGPSVALPVVGGIVPLGTWQQIVLIDFDTRPRERRIIVTVVGD